MSDSTEKSELLTPGDKGVSEPGSGAGDRSGEQPRAVQSSKPAFEKSVKPSWLRARLFPQVTLWELGALFGLTIALDYLVFQGPGGLSYSLALVGIPLVLYWCVPERQRSSTLLVLAAVFPLLAMRCLWQTQGYTIAIGIAAIFFYAVVLASGRADIPYVMVAMLETAVTGGRTLLDYVRGMLSRRRSWLSRDLDADLVKTVGIPAVVTLVFGIVFLLANSILRERFTQLWDVVVGRVGHLWRTMALSPWRICFWSGCLWCVASWLRPQLPESVRSASNRPSSELDKDAEHGDIAYRIAVNTLIAVNVLFFLYNCVDAYYLVLGKLPRGVDHSQFAHQGAFWLTVALALSTLVLGRIFQGALRSHARVRALRAWAALWGVQNYTLALWVFRRLGIYIGYNGATRMRIVGIVGTTLIIIGFTLVMVMVKRKQNVLWAIRKQLAAFAFALVLLSLAPLDWLAWSVNTPLILRQEIPRPAVQLAVQPISPEALPLLLPLLEHPDLAIAKGAAAILGQWYYGEKKALGNPERRWTEYQLSKSRALRAIGEHEATIEELVPDHNWQRHRGMLRKRTARWI